jgi:hypothetical protein
MGRLDPKAGELCVGDYTRCSEPNRAKSSQIESNRAESSRIEPKCTEEGGQASSMSATMAVAATSTRIFRQRPSIGWRCGCYGAVKVRSQCGHDAVATSVTISTSIRTNKETVMMALTRIVHDDAADDSEIRAAAGPSPPAGGARRGPCCSGAQF